MTKTTDTTAVAPTDQELRILRAYGQRGVKETIIADTQDVPIEFVFDTIDKWAEGDRATAKRVAAEYDKLPPPPSPEPRTLPKKKPEATPVTVTSTVVASTPPPAPSPAAPPAAEWAGDVWELLAQAAASGYAPAKQLATKIRELIPLLHNCLRDREDSVTREVEGMVESRRVELGRLIDELTTERDRLKRGLDEEAVRGWAGANGHSVPASGRISPYVKHAYLTAATHGPVT